MTRETSIGDASGIRENPTVLIVDDEDLVLRVAQRLVTRMGYPVMLADGGQEAIDILEANRERIGLVILDMGMPRLSGRVTFERMRGLAPSLKVLLSSGSEVPDGKEELLEMGAAGFVSKPYDLTGLRSLLESVIS